jgi:hypothetical protein
MKRIFCFNAIYSLILRFFAVRYNPAMADKSLWQGRFANITTGSILVLCTTNHLPILNFVEDNYA